MSELQLRAVVAERQLDVEFSVSAGEVLAVLGPNGAGKSTALHVIAGLVHPDAGLVRLGDRVLTDTEAGVNVATHDRRVGLLLQDPLLFPHMSVAANVAFGPHSRHGISRLFARTQGQGDRAALAARGRRRAVRRPQTAPAVRRSGPAGGDRTGAGGRTRRAAARRATDAGSTSPRPRRSGRCCAAWSAAAAALSS